MKLKVIFVCIFFASTFRTAIAQTSKSTRADKPIEVTNGNFIFNLFPDSIRIESPDSKGLIILRCRNISRELEFIRQFNDRLKDWVSQLAANSPNLPSAKVTINIRDAKDTEISIMQGSEQTTRVRTHEKIVTELLPPGWELNIVSKTFRVYVYAQTFKDLQALSAISLEPIYESIKKEMDETPFHRKSLRARYVLEGGKITFRDSKRQMAGDQLELNLGGGLGILGDKIYPEFNPFASLLFLDRFHRKDFRINFTYNNQFFTQRASDGTFITRPNSFVTVAWAKNLNRDSAGPSWIALGAGLLVRRSGDYYQGQTMKFFVAKTLGVITVSPELYLTNDYKKAIMGFRLSYNF